MPRFSLTAAVLLATCCACTSAASLAADAKMTFAVKIARNGQADLRIETDWGERHRGNWTQGVSIRELRGLSAEALQTGGAVHFVLARPAGSFDCEGLAHTAQADGQCRFAPDAGFAQAFAVHGMARPTVEQAFALAMGGVAIEWLDALRAGGWEQPTTDQAVALGIFKVTPDFVHALARAGYRNGKVETLVAFRVHGVSPETIADLAGLGYRQLTSDNLIAFRIHGVTPDFVRGMAASGYRDLTPAQLIQLRIFNVTPEFARAFRSGAAPSASQLIKLRIAGITGDDLAARH